MERAARGRTPLSRNEKWRERPGVEHRSHETKKGESGQGGRTPLSRNEKGESGQGSNTAKLRLSSFYRTTGKGAAKGRTPLPRSKKRERERPGVEHRQTLHFFVLRNEREESGQCRTPLKLFHSCYIERQGRKRPIPNTAKTLPPPVRFQENSAVLTPSGIPCYLARSRNDATVVADSISNNYA